METKANYVLIGTFAAGAVAFLFLFLVWLTGFEGEANYVEYDVLFDGSVAGLSIGGDVRYNGIRVGEVTDISIAPDPSKVLTRIRLDERTPVRVDSEARLEFQGITGVAFIELTGGSPSSPPLKPKPGEDVALLVADRSAIQQLFTSAPQLLTAANDLLIRVDRLVSENEGRVSASVRDVETLTGTLAHNQDTIEETLKNIERATNGLADAVEAYGELAHEANAMVKETRPALDNFTKGSLSEVDRLLGDTRRLIASVDRLVQEVERNPAQFLSGDEPAEYRPND